MSEEEFRRNEELLSTLHAKAEQEDDPVKRKAIIESISLLEAQQTSNDVACANWNKVVMEDKRESVKTCVTVGTTLLTAVGGWLSLKGLIDLGVKLEKEGVLQSTLPMKAAVKALEASVLSFFKR